MYTISKHSSGTYVHYIRNKQEHQNNTINYVFTLQTLTYTKYTIKAIEITKMVMQHEYDQGSQESRVSESAHIETQSY